MKFTIRATKDRYTRFGVTIPVKATVVELAEFFKKARAEDELVTELKKDKFVELAEFKAADVEKADKPEAEAPRTGKKKADKPEA